MAGEVGGGPHVGDGSAAARRQKSVTLGRPGAGFRAQLTAVNEMPLRTSPTVVRQTCWR